METPASTRRITRSQACLSAMNNNIPTSRKSEKSEQKAHSRQRNLKNDRSVALIDITNDSPIVGLAGGSLETPSSFVAKRRDCPKKTPGSGEALLRGQVKTLLQKVEEEAEFFKLSFEHRPFVHLSASPSGLAPTPANTPQVPNLTCGGDIKNILNCSASEKLSSNVTKETKIPQAVTDIDETKQDSQESVKNVMIRSLLFDFSEKSEVSDSSECSSALTYQEETYDREKSVEEDDASVWSMQVNASSSKDEDEDGGEIVEGEEAEEDNNYDEEEDEEEEEEEIGGADELFDELCEGLSKMTVQEKKMLYEFKGKHTRFVYNEDDEIEGAEEVCVSAISPGVLRLKGLPTAEGKHLRFQQEEED
ncbi:acidic leucine-rich nuclear phosphoprotein 32 family member B-like [Telopea speciosissima]|uniref:acidic leucine-rich nuclear phosphoprotein 32 family member B-like n=1 Tax=Telopea speciosissima TaxID=54955 RepID=UPI001CC814BF|nr:acidic leucine-rich nuclear phosphoprotein 32 family member B-like [Telopea speciosissima]